MTPEFLAVGYVVRDFIDDREQVGGSALYSAKTARNLGLESAIWTSAASHWPPETVFPSSHLARVDTPVVTTFFHHYDSVTRDRTSLCKELAPPIERSTLPSGWEKSRVVLLGPCWAEIEPAVTTWFETSYLGLTPQGWFRNRDAKGRVLFGRSRWSTLPRKIALIVASEDDLRGDPSAWAWMKSCAEVAVRTLGRRGHVVAHHGQERLLTPPYLATEVDPTGAGDVFSTAMLIALSEGAAPADAAAFGSVAASFVVEKPGIEGLPNREKISSRLY